MLDLQNPVPVRNDRDIFLQKILQIKKTLLPLQCISTLIHYNK